MSTKSRVWKFEVDPFEFDLDDTETAEYAIREAAMILTRLGGVIQIGSRRRQIDSETYLTEQLIFRWISYAPATRLESEDVAQPEPEPVGTSDAP